MAGCGRCGSKQASCQQNRRVQDSGLSECLGFGAPILALFTSSSNKCQPGFFQVWLKYRNLDAWRIEAILHAQPSFWTDSWFQIYDFSPGETQNLPISKHVLHSTRCLEVWLVSSRLSYEVLRLWRPHLQLLVGQGLSVTSRDHRHRWVCNSTLQHQVHKAFQICYKAWLLCKW